MSLCLCTDSLEEYTKDFIIVVFAEDLGSEKKKVRESLLFFFHFSTFYFIYFHFVGSSLVVRTSLVAHMVKNLPPMQEIQVQYLGQQIPWRREWLPPPLFLLGELHGQRSLVGYSPWGHKELDTTKQLTLPWWSSGWKSTFHFKGHRFDPRSTN